MPLSFIPAVADPLPMAALAGCAAAYGLGLHRIWARAGRGRVVHRHQWWCFAAGLVVVAGALASPLDGLAATSLTAHMAQHVLLLTVAGPLLALGAPLPTLIWALPSGLRVRATAVSRRMAASQRGSGWLTWAAAGIVIDVGVMWLWHAPVFYQAALTNGGVHALEHASFIAVSMLQWWALAAGHRSRRGLATLLVFIAAFPGTALGAAMLLSPRPWYPAYVRGSIASALADQQLAGVVMWAFGGLVYVMAAAVLFGTWLGSGGEERPVTAPRGHLPLGDLR